MISIARLLSWLYVAAFIGVGISYGKFYFFHFVAFPTMFLLLYYVFFSPRIVTKQKGYTFFYFFCGWSFLSILWSLNKSYSLIYLFYLFCGGIILCSTMYWMNSLNMQLRIFKSLIYVVSADILFSLLEVFTQFRLPISPFSKWLSFFGRSSANFISENTMLYVKSTPTGFHWNPNNLSAVMIMVLPFFLFSSKKRIKFLGALTILLLIIAAGSRGCFLAYLLTLFVWGLTFSPKRAIKMLFFYLPISLFLLSCILNIPQIKQSRKYRMCFHPFQH